jgi:hypothetical protein
MLIDQIEPIRTFSDEIGRPDLPDSTKQRD